MKVALYYFIDECLVNPHSEQKYRRYFCVTNQKFYEYRNIENHLITSVQQTNQVRRHKIKKLLPIIKINNIQLMENYLDSLSIDKTEVTEFAKAKEPNNPSWSESKDEIFSVAFKIFIDGRYYKKDGKNIDMTNDWFSYRDSVCLPIIKKWCAENGIKWYDSQFAHFLHKWRKLFIVTPDKNDFFIILKYENSEEFIPIGRTNQ